VNLKTAARRLGVHYQTAYRWVRSGELVAVKVGAGYEISEAALERFQAQRAAMERVPSAYERVDLDDRRESLIGNEAVALAELTDLVECTTVDATAVYKRAATVLANIIGDCVIVSLRQADGSLKLATFEHRDPERAVLIGAMLRFGEDEEPMYARQALDSRSVVFMPQVPQRDVRTQLRPEFHQRLSHSGFYSAISAPIVVDDDVRGTLLLSRDSPGNPYTTDDRDFVVDIASRVGAAMAQAADGRAAWALRRRLAGELAEWLHGREFNRARTWLGDEVGDEHAVALASLETTIDAATTAFGSLFGATAADCKERSVCDLVDPADEVQETFERLREGEFDFCTVVASPVAGPHRRVVLEGTIVRLPDATPCCVLYVAHAVPEVAARP
jgi:excisionase family DNA binding protein